MPGHVHVEQHEVRQLAAEDLQGLFAAARFQHLVMLGRQRGAHHAPDLRLVVHHQDLRARSLFALLVRPARENVKTDPCPGSLVTQILPPCASTRPLAMARPSPLPGTA